MKTAWPKKAIGELCDIVNGGTPDTRVPEYWSGQNLWITPAEMGKRTTPYVSDTARKISDLGLRDSSATLLPANSVILSSRAPIGHLVINSVPMATNQGCKGLVPKNGLNSKFLYYYLLGKVDVLESLGTGATFKELSASKLKDVAVPIVPDTEQRRIVGVLDQAFAAIATTRANAEKNLQNARALFQSELRTIVDAVWKSSSTVALSELASDITDGDHLPPPKSASGVPFITIGNIVKETRKIDFSDTFMVPRAYFDALKPNRKPRTGDVLYTVTGSFGIPVLVETDQEFCFQRHIAIIRPNRDTKPKWLCYLLSSPQLFQQADDAATGTAQRTVSLRALRNLAVPHASPDAQDAAVARLDLVWEQTERLQSVYTQKIAALDELRKSLLHEAFNGRL
ncbi:MAG TPA: restriction endonuclease subunit S [Candidatus Acidoferrales bacterium]|nr:restriction endonuclease subunit S [Candidatus Acidoferrales bacterium]